MKQLISFFHVPPNIPFQIQFYQVTNTHKHWHSTVELLLVLKGTVDVDVQGETSHLEDGDLLLINRNQIHELRSRNDCLALSVQLDLHKFDLPREEADQLWFACDSSRDGNKGRYDNLRSLIALIVERNASQTQDASALYDNKSFAYSMLKELTREFQAEPSPSPAQDKYLERMNEIVRYIDSHYRENLSLSQLAQADHLSPPYLSSLFSRYLGTTYSDYYNSVRLGYAANDLVSTQDSIESIAVNNGYANAQSFSRSFKARYGTLPSVYRKAHQESNFSGMGRDRRTSYLDTLPDTAGVDLSSLLRYLPRREHLSTAPAEKPCTLVTGDWAKISGLFQDPSRKLVGIGSAKEILYRDIQLQLEDVQRRIGFQYIKFHGLFSDDMLVVGRTVDGALDFNFRLIDMVFDYLFSIGLKPMLQLSFMPRELASDSQNLIFNNKYNASQPARLSEWTSLIHAFFVHIIGRYGRETVESLPVTLWNNADSSTEMFGMKDDLVFFRMYQETFQTIKALDPNIQVGAPSMTFMQQESIEWARRFYRWELDHGITPDFLCAQYYSTIWQPGEMRIDLHSGRPDHLMPQSDAQFPLLAGIPLSPNPDEMKKYRGFLTRFFTELGLEKLPIWITEWNLTVSHNNYINDTLFAGCYVIKNVVEHSSGLGALGYWSVSDFIEEQRVPQDTFHGGLGLVTTEGIRKPQFLAFELLRRLMPQVLAQGEGYIATRSQDCVTILLYNYEHFNDIFAGNKTYNVNKTTRYTPFSDPHRRPFRIRLTNLPSRPVAEAVEFIVNRENGSAYDAWIKMGAPEGGALPALDRDRLEHLKSGAHPLIRTIYPQMGDGVLECEALLEPLEFRLIQIYFR